MAWAWRQVLASSRNERRQGANAGALQGIDTGDRASGSCSVPAVVAFSAAATTARMPRLFLLQPPGVEHVLVDITPIRLLSVFLLFFFLMQK